MQARYYANAQGRFTSPDSLLGSIANPQSLNRYAYVGNNPLTSTDPTGHIPTSHSYSPSFNSGEGGWAWDDPTSPAAVLEMAGALPERYENEISDWAYQNEAAHDARISDSVNALFGLEEPQNTSDTEPFVVSNPAALESGIRADQVQYLDSNGVAQCARLPLAWQNDQDGRLVRILNPEIRERRLTQHWIMGPEVHYGDNLTYGTVLATFIRETGKYGNGEPHTGSHTVVFFRWDIQNGERGMVVGQQMAGFHGRAVIGFIPFNANNVYYQNAYRFNVVLIAKPLRRFTMADKE